VATDTAGNHQATPGTAQATTKVDATAPSSTVAALPAVLNTQSFLVSWSGSDSTGGSGLKSFDVYVSTDGGAFQPWQTGITQTSATYTGSFGHSYAFYSIATDNAGNREATPAGAQAVTHLTALILPPGPVPPTPELPRGITARLVPVKIGRKKRLDVVVSFADTGAKKSQFASPFQQPAFRNIQVSVRDSDGDGVADQVVVTARKGTKTVTRTFSG
jgi:hypothetical protein